MANWVGFKLEIPGKDFLEKLRQILETLLIFLEILKAILEVIKAFLVLFGNPLKALIMALMKLIEDLFNTLKRTGLYVWFDIPNPLADPCLKGNFGGFDAFTMRFKGGLLDSQDMMRPQPIKGFLQGGFVLICLDAENVYTLINLIMAILRFFGQDFRMPRLLAPANVKAMPMGSKGDPILALSALFSDPPKAIALEWTTSTNVGSGDRSFTGLVANIAEEFLPKNWLIERSEMMPDQEVVLEDPKKDVDSIMQDPNTTGPVMMIADSAFVNPRKLSKKIPRKSHVTDQYGDPVIKFQNAYTITPSGSTLSWLLGQLGTFRFIDENVEYDKVYYYRVRAFEGPLDVDKSKNVLKYQGPLQFDGNTGKYFLGWPSSEGKVTDITLGKPGPIIRVKMTKIPTDFDVMANVRALFLTAFSLNFHIPLPPPQGQPLFDENGDPNPPYDVTIIGLGTLAKQGGILIGQEMVPIVKSSSPAKDFSPSPITGQKPEMPWQMISTRYQTARLVTRYVSLLLENGSAMIEQFKDLMTGPLPEAQIEVEWPRIGVPASLEELVMAFTKVTYDQSTAGAVLSAVTEVNPTGTVDDDTAKAYGDAFYDANTRRNVLVGVNYLLALGFSGVEPNWMQFCILRDIIPWSGQFLYDILAKIQAILDALQGIFDEIIRFIDLIERKITALEDFIEWLISILDFLISLSLGFYLLAVPKINGSISDWFAAIDNAGGNPPPGGPGSYSGGLALAYLAPDIGGIADAIGLIF